MDMAATAIDEVARTSAAVMAAERRDIDYLQNEWKNAFGGKL
jgi:hypothetical protein